MKITGTYILLFSILFWLVGCGASVNTIENLQHTILDKQNSLRRYELFRQRALSDSLPRVVSLYDAVIMSEMIHLGRLEELLCDLGGDMQGMVVDQSRPVSVVLTLKNLYTSKSSAELRANSQFVEMTVDARHEGEDLVADWFVSMGRAELSYSRMFIRAIESLEVSVTDSLLPISVAMCGDCGGVYSWGGLDDDCEVCGAASFTFFRFD